VLPPIWNIPHTRNPNFTGRDTLLDDLHTALTSGQPAALVQALPGLGGVGKTQVAVEHAYRHALEYRLVWWLRAEEPTTLAADYAGLALHLDLPVEGITDQRLIVEAVRGWLTREVGWLLIFDNAQDPNDVRPYLPTTGEGHVVITSRNQAWRSLGHLLPVPILEHEKAIAFLLSRTGQTDRAAADQVAQEVGDLPLALEQAGAYLEITGTPLADYAILFRSRRHALWQEEKPPWDYPATVATTWSLAGEHIDDVARSLLIVCAFLAPDDIPRSLLTEGAGHLPAPLSTAVADSLSLNRAVASLERYSLLEVKGDAFAMHRLVQMVARDGFSDEQQKAWVTLVVQVVDTAFPFVYDTPQTWAPCARVLPHVLSAAEHATALRIVPEATARLLEKAGLYQVVQAAYPAARRLLQQALAINEAAYGPEHPQVARTLGALGLSLQTQGDLPAARAALERALLIKVAVYGPEHPEVAVTLGNLSNVLRKQGDLPAARAILERALPLFEAAYGPEHPEVARTLGALGIVLQAQGDLPAARAILERALLIKVAAYGPEHPEVAVTLGNLGILLQAQEDLPAACAALE